MLSWISVNVHHFSFHFVPTIHKTSLKASVGRIFALGGYFFLSEHGIVLCYSLYQLHKTAAVLHSVSFAAEVM